MFLAKVQRAADIKNKSFNKTIKRIVKALTKVQPIKQLQNYRWDPSAAKRGVEQPLKQFDDSCDAARYGCKTKVPM